jgi:2-polyprenyl-3-methyl-5-hydroxy-6-metoxy-1,4-benzoquinol methylase
MEKFQEILKKYSTHDNYTGTDKNTIHSYGPIYEKIIREAVERPDLTILEIGVFSGAFLQVLHEVFPNATIHGIDITLKNYIFDKKLQDLSNRFYRHEI